jgi:chaperone LolA
MTGKLFVALAAAAAMGSCSRQAEPHTAVPPAAEDRSDIVTGAPAAELPAADLPAAGRDARDAGDTPTSDVAAAPAQPGTQRGAGTPAGAGQPAAPPAAESSGRGDDGAAALTRAAAAYAAVTSMTADFVMRFENPLLRQVTTSRGTIYQRQPDRIALRFSEPDGDVILGDGQFFWVYYPSVNPDQVMRTPAAAGGETGVNLQAQFVGDPVERFGYELHGTEQVGGRPAQVLTLVPRQRAEYRSLKVWIDERDGLARRFEITEHNGSVRRFELSNLQLNRSIPDATFRFVPPAGVRIISTG